MSPSSLHTLFLPPLEATYPSYLISHEHYSTLRYKWIKPQRHITRHFNYYFFSQGSSIIYRLPHWCKKHNVEMQQKVLWKASPLMNEFGPTEGSDHCEALKTGSGIMTDPHWALKRGKGLKIEEKAIETSLSSFFSLSSKVPPGGTAHDPTNDCWISDSLECDVAAGWGGGSQTCLKNWKLLEYSANPMCSV